MSYGLDSVYTQAIAASTPANLTNLSHHDPVSYTSRGTQRVRLSPVFCGGLIEAPYFSLSGWRHALLSPVFCGGLIEAWFAFRRL